MALEQEFDVGSPTNIVPIDEMTDEDALLMAEIEEVDGDPADEGPAPEMQEFEVNLVPFMDEADLGRLAEKLIGAAERDKESTTKRDEQYAEGVRRSGLGKDAPGGPAFEGASEVVHPLIAEACVDFGAMMMKELFPPDGPVKVKMIDDVTEERSEAADRKKKHLNYQITTQSPGFIDAHEQMAIQLGLGGSQYIIHYWENGGPRCEFVPVDRVWLPYSASSFRAARRRTIVWDLSASVVKERIRGGMYADVIDPDVAPSSEPTDSKSQQAQDKVQGVQPSGNNEDGERRIYQMYVWHDFEGLDPLATDEETGESVGDIPYIIAVDVLERKILAIYRNWDKEKVSQFGDVEEVHWVVDWNFIPWKGPYAVGFPHLIGSISAALTGALRSLLNSAHIANFPGLVRLKGGRNSGDTERINPTENVEVSTTGGADDIRKLAMPLPYPQPNTVLFSLLGFLTDLGKGVVTTSEEKIAEAGNNMPVGTAMALLESGSKVTSSIMGRMHRSMAATLSILARMNRDYLDEERAYGETGLDIARRADYEGPTDIQPVSDPNIFSETQRLIVMQETVRVAKEMFPELNWDWDAMARRFLSHLKTPNAEELLPRKPKPQPTDPVQENVALALGEMQQAFPDQIHEAHLRVHLSFLANPLFGGSKMFAGKLIPGMLEHVKDHLLMWYEATMKAAMTAMTGFPPEVMAEATQGTDQLAATQAQVHPKFDEMAAQQGQIVLPVVEAAMNLLEQVSPSDGTEIIQAQAQAALLDVESKDRERQGKLALQDRENERKAAERAEEAAQRAEVEEAKIDQKDEELDLRAEEAAIRADQADEDRKSREALELEKLDVAVELNDDDNRTALEIARMRDRGGNPGNLKDGSSFSTRQPGD